MYKKLWKVIISIVPNFYSFEFSGKTTDISDKRNANLKNSNISVKPYQEFYFFYLNRKWEVRLLRTKPEAGFAYRMQYITNMHICQLLTDFF